MRIRLFITTIIIAIPIEIVWPQQQTYFSSIIPGMIWPADDGIHIDSHGGNIIYQAQTKTYYWYGEKRGNPQGVSCYSSSDLYNWKNEGMVFNKGSIPILERPKVIFSPSANKYVMWFHYDTSGYTLAHLAVATSDSVKGPFKLVSHFRPNGHESRDIGMYTDDNGKAYIMYAADHINKTIRIVELTADYLNATTNDVDAQAHCEGPGMFKMNGTYYLMTSHCTGFTPNQALYYTAPSVSGPWTYKGDPCVGDSTHTTFQSQPSFIFKIPGYANAFMYMGDRWDRSDLPSSRFVFLPISVTQSGSMELQWLPDWSPSSAFTPSGIRATSPFDTKKASSANPAGNSGSSSNSRLYDFLGRMQQYPRNARSSASQEPEAYIHQESP